ncbi:sugar ABC transporter permease, partial [Streptomyces sp. SID11233]|nr:sugar ABC transporter permease [Streptomyces sp. SID11233]
MTDTLPEAQATPGPAAGPGLVGKKRRKPILPDRVRRVGLPYLLLLPALLFELLIHMIPMVVGIFMAFKELTQFY